MASVTKSFAFTGVEGYLVEVEIDTIEGKPSISIVGLGDTAVKEARERLQASLIQANYEFPKNKVVINLAPGDIKKSGSHFDLAMAIGLLIQSEQVPQLEVEEFGFIGELSLNATLRPCSGVLPMVIAAKEVGLKKVIVPRDNLKEASLVQDIDAYGFDALVQVVQFLSGDPSCLSLTEEKPQKKEYPIDPFPVDFKEVQGQEALVQYILLAAPEVTTC